ncbi:hypothetical protein ACFOWE_17895 [Planomonospora corallina]|uniref:Uncharacterized protein n=1 Tax=Planomonospora corallina TaxID=1806052 RepID=A0ABV8I9X5_9ACTN
MSRDEAAASVALDGLRAALKGAQQAKEGVEQAVVDARHVETTWQRIADELGVAQPAAVRKYKPLIAQRAGVDRWSGEADRQTPAAVAVRHAREALEKAEDGIVYAVAAARSAEATWDEIADVLGVHQPNAVAKYGPLLRTQVVVDEEALAEARERRRSRGEK